MLLILGAAVNAFGAATEPASADDAQHPASAVLGRWITPKRDGVFEIDRCGQALCGRLVGMRYQGAMPLDVWKRPQCRMQLLSGFTPADTAGRWAGMILDPDNGHSYRAVIWSPVTGTLNLRGYLLMPMLGETQSWTRYAGAIGSACKLPD